MFVSPDGQRKRDAWFARCMPLGILIGRQTWPMMIFSILETSLRLNHPVSRLSAARPIARKTRLSPAIRHCPANSATKIWLVPFPAVSSQRFVTCLVRNSVRASSFPRERGFDHLAQWKYHQDAFDLFMANMDILADSKITMVRHIHLRLPAEPCTRKVSMI